MIWRTMVLGIVLCLTAAAHAAPLVTKDMLKPDPDGTPEERICGGEIDMGGGIKLPFVLGVTAKGNGELKLANLSLQIYDDHDDGRIYEGELLNTEIISLGDPEVKYMVISGTAIHTGENGNERVPEGVVFIYRFDRAKKSFSRVYKHASFDLEY